MENGTANDTAAIHWPVFAYIASLFMFGLIGNLLILYIYHFRMKQTIFGFFVQILATVDTTTVLVSLPGSLIFRFFSQAVDTSQMCKFLIFMNHCIALASGFLLSIIALQRYRKVCRPHGKQITKSLAKKLCLGVICLSFSLSLPIIFIVGVADTPVVVKNKTISVPLCDYERHLKENGQSVIYAVLVDAEFLGIACFLTAVYSCIGKTLRGRLKAKGRCTLDYGYATAATKSFLVLAIVFIVSVLPLMTISTLFSFFRSPPTLNLVEKTLFDFGVYLPYINSIINPVVYSFTSNVFRTELLSLCRRNQNGKRIRVTAQTDSEDTFFSQTVTTSL